MTPSLSNDTGETREKRENTKLLSPRDHRGWEEPTIIVILRGDLSIPVEMSLVVDLLPR